VTLGQRDVLGLVAVHDFVAVCIVVAIVATSGGWWFASRGATGLGILAIVVAAVPVVLLMRHTPAMQRA
jgi:hypothetical protein